MNYFKGTKTQISPCIASKVKYALNLKSKKPKNTKKCTVNYWLLSIESIGYEKNISDKSILKSAIEIYNELILNCNGKKK